MAGIVAIAHVGLTARDLGRLASYYRDTVGLKQTVHVPGVIAIFAVGDVDLAIQAGPPEPVRFDLAADDVDGFRAKLVAAGVACDEPVDDGRSGHRYFCFTDPEGNAVTVMSAHRR